MNVKKVNNVVNDFLPILFFRGFYTQTDEKGNQDNQKYIKFRYSRSCMSTFLR